jgi:3-methyladenine DNA glycosylase/8-oxoguanine DNA glycosylase
MSPTGLNDHKNDHPPLSGYPVAGAEAQYAVHQVEHPLILRSVNPFALRDLAFAHGWIALPPWSWRADPPAMLRVERLPSGAVVTVEITSADPTSLAQDFKVHLSEGLSPVDRDTLERRLRWMLRLDEDLSEFHVILRTLPGGEAPAARGEGRLLRSWDLFEDVLKTICTTNTTWAQTKSMVGRLVERYGERGAGGVALPMPERIAEATEVELREAGLGYRASAVRRLAAAMVAGELPREAAAWAALPDTELQARLLALQSIGPYAAGNLRMLLGHYDRLAIDSWLRRAVREAWFNGADVRDRDIEAAFAPFGRWRVLVYWFHPELHPGRDTWRPSQE